MRAVCVLVCVSLLVGGSASAGNSTESQNLPPPRFDWSGWYIGGHVADSLGRGTSTLSNPNPISVGNSFSSLYGGVQGGYNYVFPSRLLLGAEADMTFPNFQTYADGLIFTGGTVQGTTVTDQIDYIATLRGRFGYAFDHWLIYGTGGFAWSLARFGETPGVASDEDKILLTRTGWALGLGAEVPIAPDWTARIEYLYDRFGNVAGVFPSGTGYGSVFDINTLRFGLNYKLGSAEAATAENASSDPWPIARDNLEYPRAVHLHWTGLSGFSFALRRREQPLRRQSSQEYGERHGIYWLPPMGWHRHLHRSGNHPGLWSQHHSWHRGLPQF